MTYWHIFDCVLLWHWLKPRFTPYVPPENISDALTSIIARVIQLLTAACLIHIVLPDFGVVS